MQKDKETGVKPASGETLNEAVELLVRIREARSRCDWPRVERGYELKEKRRRRLRIARSCAAVLLPLLIAGGAMWFMSGERQDAAIHRVAGNVMLTLPNGSQVSMDEVADNALVGRHGNVVVQREAGSLVYTQDESAAPAKPEVLYSILDVPRGNQFDIILSDGTHVWLNSDSRLRFPSSFMSDDRRVFLQGEAYFDVAHDAGRPFIVETDVQLLTVLGTGFNVYAYPGESAVYTTLVEGSVVVRSLKSSAEMILVPNQQARLDIEEGTFTVEKVDAREQVAWKERTFVFEGDNMEQIMQKLARWYDLEYSFEDSEARNFIARGSFGIPEDVNSILRLIELSGDIGFEVKGNKIKVSMRR